MKRTLIALLISFVMFGWLNTVSPVYAQSKAFTKEELSAFDGVGEHKAYYAYEGKVYDVTGSRLWKEGEHFGLQAGTDLTGKLGDAPHGTEVFSGFEVVGTYSLAAASPITQASPASEVKALENNNDAAVAKSPWFTGRLRLLGISILGWTGILLAVTFVLNFATCFALPWSKFPLPWKGARPGPDPLDASPSHMRWAQVHKYFAWGTVLFGIVHGVVGFFQLLGIYL